jgi:hypothetical protein
VIAVKGTVQNGQVLLPSPIDLPDGTEVTVLSEGAGHPIGIAEDEWPTDPEGIARLVARMEQVEPFDLTPEEEADTAAWRRKISEYTRANQDKAVEGLFE